MHGDSSTWPLIRFGVIKDAWRLYTQHALVWSLAVFIVICANAVASSVLFAIIGKGHGLGPGGFRLYYPAAGAMGYLLSMTVSGFFVGGLVRMASRQIGGSPPRLEDLFSITDCWFDLLLVSFLIGVATWVGMHLCVLPGFIVYGLFMLAIPLVAEGHLPATGALIQSWHALKSQWLTASVFHWVLTILAVSGFCCLVGVLITGPLYALTVSILYRNFLDAGLRETWTKHSDPIPEI